MSRLAENLALLLLDDETGKSTVDLGRRHRAVGSAVLLDLVRAGRLTIPATSDSEPRVQIVGSGSTGDAALDAALAKLSDSPKVGWAAENAGHEAWKPLLELLAEDGAIRLEEQRVLGVIKVKTWPAADPTRERAVRDAIAAALQGGRPDEETAVLITILHGIGQVPGAGDPAVKARAEEIAKTAAASGPLKDAFHGLDTLPAFILFAAS
ncbi:GPP34 family phosphoprotein [Actinoplanes sp. NPDC026670]|uniref:GOLPH3/VPS74 family protein n=1 Tax=Actinoplanes sp. NPDC026670 TaxID=3154700 RepID=UPI0033D7B5E4